jgi:hypothetical protein
MKMKRNSKTGNQAPAASVSCREPAPLSKEGLVLNDALPSTFPTEEQPMIRSQIYLSRGEHEFLLNESVRTAQSMAAVIRSFVDEKMRVPDSTWANNSLLAPPADPSFSGPEDGVINHDHYVYGGPKKWARRRNQWMEAPPVPEDYHSNPASAIAHDRKVEDER